MDVCVIKKTILCQVDAFSGKNKHKYQQMLVTYTIFSWKIHPLKTFYVTIEFGQSTWNKEEYFCIKVVIDWMTGVCAWSCYLPFKKF